MAIAVFVMLEPSTFTAATPVMLNSQLPCGTYATTVFATGSTSTPIELDDWQEPCGTGIGVGVGVGVGAGVKYATELPQMYSGCGRGLPTYSTAQTVTYTALPSIGSVSATVAEFPTIRFGLK